MDKTRIEDLLEDINYAYQERESDDSNFTHYFGTIVLHDTGVVQGETDDFDKYDIIDGQQRISTISIIISTLIEEINNTAEFNLSDDHAVSPGRLAQESEDDFISQYGTIRIRLDSINNETFEEIVVYDDPLDDVPDNNLAQRRLIEAKEEVRDWFENKREQFTDETLDCDEYYQYLIDLGRTIRNALEVTTYEIEDETEAGRLFEVVNDRGRDLTTLDKIKSYLVYCAGRQDDSQLGNKIYRKFGEIIEKITEHGGTDDDIEVFVNNHWTIYSGEINRYRRDPQYTEIHRRIKHLNKHAERKQNKTDIRTWIDAYLESITECSEAFALLENPSSITPENQLEADIKSKIDGVTNLPVSRNFYPLLMAGYIEYGFTERFYNLLSLCEIFSFRIYNVGGRRTDAAGNPLRRHAYWMNWAEEKEHAKRVFSGEETPIRYDNSSDALRSACEMLETQIGNHCPDTFLVNCLLRNDIFDGTDQNDGWTGVRNRTVISYLLYRYEKHLRSEDQRSNISQIPPFSQWRSEGITIEHIHPQNPDSSTTDDDLESVVDSIGNLILLGPEDNSGAGNDDYEKKYEEVYSSSSMEMVSELPEPDEGWSKEDIEERSKRITSFVLSEWDSLSTAHVHVGNTPTNFDVTELTQPAHEVRNDYARRHQFRVPSVNFRHESANSQENWEIISSCSHCDSTLVNLESTQDWDAECGGCGMDLENPSYKFKSGEYILTE